jgi:TolB-like protein/cytochrome c-type biogenesis protein CcmH/NrfG
MRSFFRELKQRKVYRAAVGYAIVAWLIVQISATVIPAYHGPEWILPLLITGFALGFPVALLLAWAFDLTGGAIKKAPTSTDATLSGANKRRFWLLAGEGLIVSAIVVAVYWLWHPWREASTVLQPAPAAMPTIVEKSIAVLPFENLSRDPESAYLAEGIQQEILTRLANIADLRAISRSSTRQYQSKPGNLSEIAKQLRVAHVLEGSVQKVADQVRVNVQLVNAQTDSHLWANTYDRKLTDIFHVETEIAKRIAESLHAKLTGREEQALAVKPTNNPEAYDAYLRGLAFEARSAPFASLEAAGFYERAVQLDPNFAIAWARLSRTDAAIYFDRYDASTATRGEAAKRALENAQKLEPNAPETLLALGYYQYGVLDDYAAAKTTFGRVSQMLPGSSEVLHALAKVTRREGNWDQSIAYFEQALVLDPRNVVLLTDAAFTYTMLRQFPAVLKLYDRVLDIKPNDPDAMAAKAGVYQAQGKLQEAGGILSEIHWQTPSEKAFGIKIDQLRFEQNYADAARLLQARLAQFNFGSEYDRAGSQIVLAFAQRLAGLGPKGSGTCHHAFAKH